MKKAVLKNFAIFTGKKPVLESLFNNVAGFHAYNFIKERLQYGKIFKNIYFEKHLQMTASVDRKIFYRATES